MEQMFTVVGIGEVLWDLLPEGRQPGGAPANVAFHAEQLGARALIISAVGDDEPGRALLERLHELGTNIDEIAIDPHHPTGTVSVTLSESGQPDFVIHENVAWDHLPPTPGLAPLAQKAHAVCFGTLAQRSPASRQTIRAFLDQTRPECLRVFDVNLRQHWHSPQIITDLLQRASVVKLNEEELPIVLAACGIDQQGLAGLHRLRERYHLRLAALTRGARGSVLVASGGVFERGGEAVQVVDAVGAGDAFTAGLIMGLLRNEPLEQIHSRAARLAAYVCARPGATPTLPQELA